MSDSTSTAAEVIPLVISLKYILQQHTEHTLVSHSEEIRTSASEIEPDTEWVTESKEDKEATQVVNIMRQIMQAEVEKIFSLIEGEDLYRIATYINPK